MSVRIKVWVDSCSSYIDFPIPEDSPLGQELLILIDWWESGEWLTDEEAAVIEAEVILKEGKK